MTRRRLGIAALCTAAALAPFAACDVYDETLLSPEGGASSSSGSGLVTGRGIGYWSGTGDQDCPSARKPAVSDRPRATSQADVGALVFALRHIDLGTTNPEDGGAGNEDYKRLGFDVDGLCSGSSKTCGKSSPKPACAPLLNIASIDGEYCRDNSFGQLADTITYASSVTSGFGFGTFDCALCAGALNFLVRIQGYNGEPSDDSVEVDFYPAVGLQGGILPIDCKASVPDSACFRADQKWDIDRSVVTGAGPGDSYSTLRSTAAFVKDGYVTIFLPDPMPIYFPGDDTIIHAFPITVHGGFITGKLQKQDDGRWRVDDGMIGGASTIAETLDSLVAIGLCEDDVNYNTAKGVIDNVADVLASGAHEPTTPCDSISVGIGFVALQSSLGDAVQAPVRDYCGGGTDAGDGG